ncbi:MAG: endonuclease domain-containing protein [Desulfobacterales bacterium]
MNTNITSLARKLRKRSTDTEKLLWRYLRAKQLEGFKFKRQQPIGNYIVDFVCFEKCIVIEIDGGQHAVEKKKDKERDDWLKKQGLKVLRFWSNEVLINTKGVLEVIRKHCLSHPPLTPPIKGGEERENFTSGHGGKKEPRVKRERG